MKIEDIPFKQPNEKPLTEFQLEWWLKRRAADVRLALAGMPSQVELPFKK